MANIPDDPIIDCMMRTGEPPWIAHPAKVWTPFGRWDEWEDDEDEWEGESEDVYFGNETEDF